MSFRRAVPIITFIALFAMALRISVDTDTWWHLRTGAWIVENQRLPATDPFSSTRAGAPWINPGWVSELVLYAVYSALGFAGLNLFTAAMVAIGFAFVWQVMPGRQLLRSFVVLLAGVVTGVYWSARPQIVSFALAGLMLLILERARLGNLRVLWFMPVVMAVWANIHGGFAIGLILIAMYSVGELVDVALPILHRTHTIHAAWRENKDRLMRWAWPAVLSVAAISLNPYGPSLLVYPFKTTSIRALQDYVQEWQSPDFHQLQVQPFLWMVGLVVLAFISSRTRLHPTEFVLFAGLGYMSLVAGRNIALFGLGLAPVLSRHADSSLDSILTGSKPPQELPQRFTRWINLGLVCLVALGALVKAYTPLSVAANEALVARQSPTGAIAYLLHERPAGPLFNEYNWGGYILWTLYPDYPSFVDGRTDLFDDQILQEYIQAWRADPGWQEVLARRGIRVAVLDPAAPLTRALIDAGWVTSYRDAQAIILARTGSP